MRQSVSGPDRVMSVVDSYIEVSATGLENRQRRHFAALSALFKVDGILRRVGGENDYICYAGKRGIHNILKK